MPSTPLRFGEYVLHERLGVGGMGEVFLATRKDAGRGTPPLVVKVLLPEFAADPAFIAMLHDECRIGKHLAHPNIVEVYEVGVVGESHYIALEHVHGVNLRKLHRAFYEAGERFPPLLAVEIVVEVLHALHHAHRANGPSGKPFNIVHRDLSPENLMVSFDGDAKVLDFGIAKAEGRISTTRAGVVKGKAGYMAPEQAKGDPVDARADQYAMGLILLELLTTRRRFSPKLDQREALQRAKTWVAHPPSKFYADNAPLDAIVLKALELSPDKRWESAAEFASALFRVAREMRRNRIPESLPAAMRRLFPDIAEPFLQDIPQARETTDTFRLEHARRSAESAREEDEPIPLTEDDEVTRVSGSGPADPAKRR